MTDRQIEKVLAEGCAIAAVLLARGGWLRAEEVRLGLAFAADESPAVWKVELITGTDDVWHSVFVEAANIVGISVDRRRDARADRTCDAGIDSDATVDAA
jgi:hypothetical protein